MTSVRQQESRISAGETSRERHRRINSRKSRRDSSRECVSLGCITPPLISVTTRVFVSRSEVITIRYVDTSQVWIRRNSDKLACPFQGENPGRDIRCFTRFESLHFMHRTFNNERKLRHTLNSGCEVEFIASDGREGERERGREKEGLGRGRGRERTAATTVK